jgi:integrase
VQKIADTMIEAEVSPSTIANRLMPLRVIFRRAVQDELVHFNPTEHLRLPAARGKRERIASPNEAEALLAVLEAKDRALWATAFYAGLRTGELRALRWERVDFAAGVVDVNASFDDRNNLNETKTKAGTRRVPILGALRGILLEHKLATGGRGLVFGTAPEKPFSAGAAKRRAVKRWDAAELLQIQVHEARHTFASILIAAGVNAKAISTYLGHSSIQVTFDIYGHLMPGNEDVAVGLADAYLEKASAATASAR